MSRPHRIPGFSYVGLHRYFLTTCTLNRIEAFRDATNVDRTLLQFRRTATLEGFAILAYCLMPDHAHFLLAALKVSSDFQRFAKLAKQRSGGVHARAGDGRLWQEGYDDRLLREDENMSGVVRYILENPVRAGLVATPHEYPYLGSDLWTLDELLA